MLSLFCQCVYVKKKNLAQLMLLILAFGCSTTVSAQFKNKKKMTAEEYIGKYKSVAISEMRRSQIPASIILSQGLLESGFGNSYLARKGRNHFGIKCHKGWRGMQIQATDDGKRTCFRKYKSVYASYIDHSNFLLQNQRYNQLFSINDMNYIAWAKGLKKAGYATNPKYDAELLRLINKYDLHKFDQMYNVPKNMAKCDEMILATQQHYNGIRTVLFDCAVTPELVERAYKVKLDDLTRFNNFNPNDTIMPNSFVYLQAPRSKGPTGIKEHRVSANETMSSIAHLYGIKVNALYKKNNMPNGAEPLSGELVSLRTKNNEVPKFAVDGQRYQKGMQIVYTVKKGDNLYNIARNFNTSVKTIKKTNKLKGNLIHPGDSLTIVL